MMKFKTYHGEPISLEEISDLICEQYDYTVWVGTDSQVKKKIGKVQYSTCIVVHKKGKGGRVFVHKSREPYTKSLQQRLANEVWRSLETSFELKNLLPANADIVIDIDVNRSKKFKSGNYHEQLVGMVVGQGFKCRVKPDAWAAQCVADKFAKS